MPEIYDQNKETISKYNGESELQKKYAKLARRITDNVKTKIGSGATEDYTEVSTDGEYAMIVIFQAWTHNEEPFGYNVPGPNETISITFTVSGW